MQLSLWRSTTHWSTRHVLVFWCLLAILFPMFTLWTLNIIWYDLDFLLLPIISKIYEVAYDICLYLMCVCTFVSLKCDAALPNNSLFLLCRLRSVFFSLLSLHSYQMLWVQYLIKLLSCLVTHLLEKSFMKL